MISELREATETLVLDRSDDVISTRLLELRVKIHDKDYVNNAIQRIAQVISRKLVEDPNEFLFRE